MINANLARALSTHAQKEHDEYVNSFNIKGETKEQKEKRHHLERVKRLFDEKVKRSCEDYKFLAIVFEHEIERSESSIREIQDICEADGFDHCLIYFENDDVVGNNYEYKVMEDEKTHDNQVHVLVSWKEE